MRLSVVVPCLNEAQTIVPALGALAAMRARGVEVIVVDGGSSDATVALARPLVDLVLGAPRGRALQMNAGAARASGEAILFLHADTRLPPDADALVLGGLERGPSRWGRFDVRIEGAHPLLPMIGAAMNARSRLTGIATGDQAMFVERALFDAVGGFPPIALMENMALSSRLKRVGPPLCLRSCVATSGRRWEKHGVTRTVLLMWRLRLAYALGADPSRLAQRYAPHRSA